MQQESLDRAMRLAVDHHRAGRLHEAMQIYEQSLARFPDHPEILHLMGLVASQTGDADRAITLIRRAILINPGNPLYHSNLGVTLRDLGRLGEAIDALQRAIELKPRYPEALNHLGNALRDLGQLPEAIAAYQQALRLQPDLAIAHNNLGSALRDSGQIDQAVEAFTLALRLKPDYASACRNLGNALNERGDQKAAIEFLQKAVALKPDDSSIHQSLLFAMAHHPACDEPAICGELRRWARRHADQIPREIFSPAPDASPDRCLKIAYVSRFFCDNADLHYVLPLLANHDREQFEIILFSDVVKPDDFSTRLRDCADRWFDTVGLDDAQVSQLIRHQQIDIAVLHSPSHRLLTLARKVAPIQLTWLYSASSTGLEAIDYRISDPFIDPPETAAHFYSEQTLRLPETAWCYDPLVRSLPVNGLPALANGQITFGSLNRLAKLNADVLALWSNVLNAVAGSHLYLLAPEGSARQRVRDAFASHAIDPQRIHFASRQPRGDYLRNYHNIDIVLDTFPYNGHTTSLDALWMGVPVVTLAHRPPVGRVGVSLLSNLRLLELIARTPENFLKIAKQLAGDLPALANLRLNLRDRLQASPLMDAKRFARNLESAYRDIWRTWCKAPTHAEQTNFPATSQPTP